MDWLDVDDILFDGTKEEIKKIKCPDCGGTLEYSYFEGRFEERCQKCGAIEIQHGGKIPNCVLFFGPKNTLN